MDLFSMSPEMLQICFRSLAATAVISVAPIFILAIIPIGHGETYNRRLKVLLSFASGGLLGDAFLHLIPHAVMEASSHQQSHGHAHSHAHSHAHAHSHGGHGHSHGGGQPGSAAGGELSVGIWVLAGIVTFLAVEKIVRIVKGPGSHGHSHSLPAAGSSPPPTASSGPSSEDKMTSSVTSKDQSAEKSATAKNDGEMSKGREDREKAAQGDAHDSKIEVREDLKVAGYLNLAADFAHNFTDGLAIGASFLQGNTLGMVTASTIFLHEIPHEIGDYAILLQSGCSKHRAMALQFSTAVGAMLGTLTSLLAGGVGAAATAWILPFTAGGFIYIATVSVIPELLEEKGLLQSITEILALLVGIFLMVLIVFIE